MASGESKKSRMTVSRRSFLARAVAGAGGTAAVLGGTSAHKGHPVIGVTGDGGIGYTIMEMETMSKNRLPGVVIVYNNNAWGTWTQSANDKRSLPIQLLQENVRYDKVAEALGAHGEYVSKPDQFRPALERAYKVAVAEGRPALVNCQGRKEFWDRTKFAPGFLGKVEPGVMVHNH
jgi:acetolactate synthase I/II/III large subunit